MSGKVLFRLFRLILFAGILAPSFIILLIHYAFSPRIKRGVQYGHPGQLRQDMDIFFPPPDTPLFSTLFSKMLHGSQKDAGSNSDTNSKMNSTTGSINRDEIGSIRPTLVFVSGGAWMIGYKLWGVAMARSLAALGCVTVLLDYPNYPQAAISGQIAAVDRAIDFVTEQLPEWGGDPKYLYVAGQSAGAHILACVLLERAVRTAYAKMQNSNGTANEQMKAPTSIRRAICISGPYDLISTSKHFIDAGVGTSLVNSLFEGKLERFSPARYVKRLARVHSELRRSSSKRLSDAEASPILELEKEPLRTILPSRHALPSVHLVSPAPLASNSGITSNGSAYPNIPSSSNASVRHHVSFYDASGLTCPKSIVPPLNTLNTFSGFSSGFADANNNTTSGHHSSTNDSINNAATSPQACTPTPDAIAARRNAGLRPLSNPSPLLEEDYNEEDTDDTDAVENSALFSGEARNSDGLVRRIRVADRSPHRSAATAPGASGLRVRSTSPCIARSKARVVSRASFAPSPQTPHLSSPPSPNDCALSSPTPGYSEMEVQPAPETDWSSQLLPRRCISMCNLRHLPGSYVTRLTDSGLSDTNKGIALGRYRVKTEFLNSSVASMKQSLSSLFTTLELAREHELEQTAALSSIVCDSSPREHKALHDFSPCIGPTIERPAVLGGLPISAQSPFLFSSSNTPHALERKYLPPLQLDSPPAIEPIVGSQESPKEAAQESPEPTDAELFPYSACSELDIISHLPPMSLYHGSADRTVPHTSSCLFAKCLIEAGMSSNKVGITIYPGKSHTDPILEDPLSGDDPLLADIVSCIAADVLMDAKMLRADMLQALRGAGPGEAASILGIGSLTDSRTLLSPVWLMNCARRVNPF